MYCLANSNDINFALIDVDANEMLRESFNYKTVDYGFSVPYYIYVTNGHACHIEQKLWSASQFQATLEKCDQGIGMKYEKLPYLRNKYTIFWEYTKKDVGSYFSNKFPRFLLYHMGLTKAHWLYPAYLNYFGEIQNGTKQAGINAMLFICLPGLIIGYLILKRILNCLCACCCLQAKN